MAGLERSVFRFYAHTLSNIYEILPYAYASPHYTEIQIVLTFARDYDAQGNNTTGEFFPYFDTSSIAPQDIIAIRQRAPTSCSIKFFLSIGGRDPRFPFVVNSDVQMRTWIANAIKSLRGIIQQYGIDGIDVYYEFINSNALPYFPNSIARLIENLRVNASITVSDPLIDIYGQLYSRSPDLIDTVVYQCFTLPDPIRSSDELRAAFRRLYDVNPPIFPREKILAGYSDWPRDTQNVEPAIFVVALGQLLREGILGFSMWHGNPQP